MASIRSSRSLHRAPDDPTHGARQLTFFNAHYDTWCYLPVAGFLTFNHEPEVGLRQSLLQLPPKGRGRMAKSFVYRDFKETPCACAAICRNLLP